MEGRAPSPDAGGDSEGPGGPLGAKTMKTGWQNWASGSKRAGCNKEIMGKVTSRKGGARSSSSAGWDKAGWTEAAARTFGAGHQGNPSRRAVKAGAGWLGRRQTLSLWGTAQLHSLSLGRAQGADPAWTHGSGPDKLLRFQWPLHPGGYIYSHFLSLCHLISQIAAAPTHGLGTQLGSREGSWIY